MSMAQKLAVKLVITGPVVVPVAAAAYARRSLQNLKRSPAPPKRCAAPVGVEPPDARGTSR
jgi:hypothetical protein